MDWVLVGLFGRWVPFSFPRRLGLFRWMKNGSHFIGMGPFGVVFVPGVVLLPWVGSFHLRWDGGRPLLDSIGSTPTPLSLGMGKKRGWMHPHPRIERSNPHLRHVRVVVVVATHERKDENKRHTSIRNNRRVTRQNHTHDKTNVTKHKRKKSKLQTRRTRNQRLTLNWGGSDV